jgi:HK97 family phage major capsid protein
MDAAISDYDAQVRDLVAREKREQEAAELYEADARIFGDSAVKARQGAEQDVIRAWYNDGAPQGDLEVNVRAAAKERAMLRSGASPEEIRNAITWDTGSAASAVPVDMARTLYEAMEASIAAFRIGAEQITTSSGNSIEFPKLATFGAATQVSAQGTALAGTDPTFDKLTLGANKYGKLVLVANEVLSDAAFDVAGFLGRNIGRQLGRLIDTDLVLGSGGITEGMVSTNLGTAATGGTLTTLPVNPNWLISTVYKLTDEYRSNAKWLFKDATVGEIRKLRDGAGGTEGAYLWEASRTNGLVNGEPDRLLGFPMYTDPNVAAIASNAIVGLFGDFSSYYLRTVGNVQIDSSVERYFDTDQTGFRGKFRVDGGYIDTTAVVAVRNRVS